MDGPETSSNLEKKKFRKEKKKPPTNEQKPTTPLHEAGLTESLLIWTKKIIKVFIMLFSDHNTAGNKEHFTFRNEDRHGYFVGY